MARFRTSQAGDRLLAQPSIRATLHDAGPGGVRWITGLRVRRSRKDPGLETAQHARPVLPCEGPLPGLKPPGRTLGRGPRLSPYESKSLGGRGLVFPTTWHESWFSFMAV